MGAQDFQAYKWMMGKTRRNTFLDIVNVLAD